MTEQYEQTAPDPAARLAEIRERVARATPGPWTIVEVPDENERFVLFGNQDDDSSLPNLPDAQFIAGSRDDVAWLLAQIDAERERAETAERERDEAVANCELNESHHERARDAYDKIRAWLCDNALDAKYAETCDVPGCPKSWQEEVDALTSKVETLAAENAALRRVADAARKLIPLADTSCGLCYGKRMWMTNCSRCGDSGEDHFCNDDIVKCDKPLHAAIDAATAALAAVPAEARSISICSVHKELVEGCPRCNVTDPLPALVREFLAAEDEHRRTRESYRRQDASVIGIETATAALDDARDAMRKAAGTDP